MYWDSRVSGFICDGQMQGGKRLRWAGLVHQCGRILFSSSTASRTVCKIVEYVLRPDTDTHNRAVVSQAVVNGLGRKSRLATRPFSFIPSQVPMS